MIEGLPLSCLSATIVLAYCQHYICKFIPGRCFTNTNMHALITWLGCAQKGSLRSLRQHQGLAVHIALLQASNLLTHNNAVWSLSPGAVAWLQSPHEQQINYLLQTIETCRFRTAAEQLALTETIPEHLITYTYQQLTHQKKILPIKKEDKGYWLQINADEWQLCCSLMMPTNSIFHLLQLGSLQSISFQTNEMALSITPLTIAKADRSGYSISHMRYIMEETAGQQLTTDQQNQFLSWIKHSDAYSLHPVSLLTTKQPQQLATIIENGNLRQHVHIQLSSRHAIVSPQIFPSLKKWAERQSHLLNSSYEETLPRTVAANEPNIYYYLALHLLVELGKLIPLPYAPPTSLMAQIASQISPEQQAELNNLAQQAINHLQEAIDGQDAFFPARQAPTPWLIQQIRQAIQQQATLTIQYLPLNAPEPKRHTVEPHRMEKRGQLYYLHAYSHRAEANLTFRLDRITHIDRLDSEAISTQVF